MIIFGSRAPKQSHQGKVRRAIAKAFNDNWTFSNRVPYLLDPGTPHDLHHAWMCPECNKVHPARNLGDDGVHFDACCTTPAGGRLYEGIRLPTLRDPA